MLEKRKHKVKITSARDQDTSPRKLGVGQWKGRIWIADDFDKLPEDDLKLFTGEAEEEEAKLVY